MLSKQEGKKAVLFARTIVEATVQHQQVPSEELLPSLFSKKHGAFVTLHTMSNHLLRGCIGIPESTMSLTQAIKEAAISVTHDPRFPPLTAEELSTIIVEVTILTPPEQIFVEQAADYLDKVTIGKDGLIVEKGFRKGLLLPQVPVEQNWDVETFLSQTCLKAGLSPDAWIDEETTLFKFSGQIFSECEPHGAIQEKQLNGP